MFADAINYHNSLMVNGNHITDLSGVDVYRIYGTGQDTIAEVLYDANGNEVDVYRLNCGDGTVTSASATNNSTLKPTASFNCNHNDLVSDDDVISYIFDCIDGTVTRSAQTAPQVNDRGWLVGYDNKRITVVAQGGGSFQNLLDSTVIQTAAGQPVVRDKNKLYIENRDGTRTEVGTVYKLGDETIEFFMRNGDYSFQFTSEPDSIRVEYSDGGYYEKVLTYSTPNASSATVTVSSYDSKNVLCVQTVNRNGIGLSATVSPYELPEDQLFDYKNPNK